MIEIKEMRIDSLSWFRHLGLGFTMLFLAASVAQAAPAAQMKQESFTTPENAVEALVVANRNNKATQLLNILGPRSGKLIFSGDSVADKQGREKFLEAYDATHKLENIGEDKRILVIGREEWPLPIPIIRTGDAWRFDTAAGEQEILNRRIGRNELSVINVCRAYVEAQREFAEKNPQADGKPAYARKLHSTRGKKDGLYWHTKPGEEESPLGPLVAAAETEGYSEKTIEAKAPYHGYFYKILTAQGNKASGGAKKYTIGNRMTKGFALIAFPAKYGDSGVMTFIINQDGIVFEKNLGPKTTKIGGQITQYNPDLTWKMPQTGSTAGLVRKVE